jgi:hypothetical protein
MTEEEREQIAGLKQRFPRWEHVQFEYGRWTATHENYDVSWEGDEDGWVSNGLLCEGRTLSDLADEIEAKEEEMAA